MHKNDSKIGHLDDLTHVHDTTNLTEANTLLNTQIAAYHQMYIAVHSLNDTMTLISFRYFVTSTVPEKRNKVDDLFQGL